MKLYVDMSVKMTFIRPCFSISKRNIYVRLDTLENNLVSGTFSESLQLNGKFVTAV